MKRDNRRINDNLKKAALYTRVSTEEQAMHGVSLDAQKERLIQYAKDNDLLIVDIYVDEGISARKRYTKRPEFMRMLNDIKTNKIDVILFIKLDRWFRNIADYYEVQTILDKHNVQWIATEEDYDTTTANGRLSLNIKLAIAQDESDRTSERIKFVFKNMVKEGRVITGSTPLGYKIVDKHMAIDENTVEIVKTVFNKYIDTRSMKETSRYILDIYGKSIDTKTIKHILKNRIYLGEAYGIKKWCQPIISEDTFEIANQLLEVRSARYDGTRSDRTYLFTGLVFCQCCGRRMTTYSCPNKNKDGTVKQSFIYYRCPAHTMKICEMSKQINQEKLEKWLVENIRFEAERYNVSLSQRQVKIIKTVDTNKILAKIEKLKDLYLNDLIPKDMYERDYTTLSKQLKQAEEDSYIKNKKPINMDFFDDFENTYQKLTPQSKKAFWSRTIKSIFVTKDGDFNITLNQL